MTPHRFLVAAAFLAATALAGAGVAAAESTGTPTTPSRSSHLLLTVNGRHIDASSKHDALLTCNPSGGTHPRAAQACADLATAQGDFAKLPKKPEFCPMIYAPVTATASGTYEGKRIDFRQEFDNRCLLARVTGHVFEY